MTTSASSTSLPSSPTMISTVVGGNIYYATETINIRNNISLTSLSILINVPKTFGAQGTDSYTNFPGDTIYKVWNETSNSIQYIFQLMPGKIVPVGQWQVTAQFSLIGQARPTVNDTYIIQISSYQDITGHF